MANEKKKDERPVMTVEVRGGVVTAIYSTVPEAVQVILVDHDAAEIDDDFNVEPAANFDPNEVEGYEHFEVKG